MRKINSNTIKQLKSISLTVLILASGGAAVACDACEKQKAKILSGISHGPGPESNWDYVIVFGMILFTLYILFATIKCTFRPSEKDENHIKRLILNDKRQ